MNGSWSRLPDGKTWGVSVETSQGIPHPGDTIHVTRAGASKAAPVVVGALVRTAPWGTVWSVAKKPPKEKKAKSPKVKTSANEPRPCRRCAVLIRPSALDGEQRCPFCGCPQNAADEIDLDNERAD